MRTRRGTPTRRTPTRPHADTGNAFAGDASVDAPGNATTDATTDATADVTTDATADGAAGTCPAGVAPLDVCGCGCCGGGAMGRACYYPSLGETRDAIPNPLPPPATCAAAGCAFGVRHLCCADPGPGPASGKICGIDTSIEDLSRFTVTKREGGTCTTLEVGGTAPVLPISGPPGYANANAWRGPCDGSTATVFAIGGLGRVTPGSSGTLLPFPRYDVHVALFFDAGTGVADVARIDLDDVGIAPRCTSDACPVCGTVCSLDVSYRYGYVGGLVQSHDTVTLTPPASFNHLRSSMSTMPADMSCAPPFPSCGAAAIDVGDVMAAILDPEVQQALVTSQGAGTTPFYGVDARPSDGQAFAIERNVGGGFLVGGPCPAGASPSSCMPIPAGLSRLVSVLTALDQQQLADPSCAALHP